MLEPSLLGTPSHIVFFDLENMRAGRCSLICLQCTRGLRFCLLGEPPIFLLEAQTLEVMTETTLEKLHKYFRDALSHVLWIGGGTDAGKSSVTDELATRHGLQVYHYDKFDRLHHALLALRNEKHRRMFAASTDELWLEPSVEDLVQRSLESFEDRWPLVVQQLLEMPQQPRILAEGFGLMPQLVAPIVSGPSNAIWLVPSFEFKRASMARRNKFRDLTSDPQHAVKKLLGRDAMLAERSKLEAEVRGFRVIEVDDSQPVEVVAGALEQHFGLVG